MNYRRLLIPGGTYFFTVVTFERKRLFLNESNIVVLRDAFRYVIERHPFQIDAVAILPDHIHAIWTVPENDANYPMRWRLLKSFVSRNIGREPGESSSPSRDRKGERSVWHRRYWEHMIRDEKDYNRHIDYIHYNPVKHGWVSSPEEWQYSSLRKYMDDGLYPPAWGKSSEEIVDLEGVELEEFFA